MTRAARIALRQLAIPTIAVVVLVLAAADASAQLRDAQVNQLTATDGTVFDVTSAMVRVPEQHSATGAAGERTIDLAVVRIRRAGSPATASAHVFLAGGPGDSGVNQALGLARQGGAVIADLLKGDVIGIDQRGSGKSVPNLASPALYGFAFEQPGSLEHWLPKVEQVSTQEAARFRAAGIRLEAYNTRESADDVAAVCAALNYERVTLWGRSYGTHLALATLARHERLVERMVLISPEGLDHTWKLPSRVDAILRALESKGAGEIVAPLTAVLDKLRGAPVTVSLAHPQKGTVTVVLGAFDVQWAVSQALGDPRTLVTLPTAIREMRDGDFQRMAQITMLRRERAGVQSAMKMMMDVSSGASAQRRAQIEREAQTALLGNAINFPGFYLSRAWGANDLGDEFRRPDKSSIPALIIGGDLDPRTPLENAREVAATLPRASVVTVENATHQFDVFGSLPIRQAIGRFLSGGEAIPERITLPALAFK